MPQKLNKKGFTLIELMVAVSVIAILSGITLSVVNVQRIRERALDSVKKEDLQTIATALERYYADKNRYPDSGCPVGCSPTNYINSWNSSSQVYISLVSDNYLKSFPRNPTNHWYDYWVDPTNQNYCVCSVLTGETVDVLNGCTAPSPMHTYICYRNPF